MVPVELLQCRRFLHEFIIIFIIVGINNDKIKYPMMTIYMIFSFDENLNGRDESAIQIFGRYKHLASYRCSYNWLLGRARGKQNNQFNRKLNY